MGQPFVGSDNGYGYLRRSSGAYDLTYLGSGIGHSAFADLTSPQPADFNSPSNSTLIRRGTPRRSAYSVDSGETWTIHETPAPAGFGNIGGMAKLSGDWNVDEDGFVWVGARQSGAPNHVYIFKSTDETATAWTQMWDATTVLGWTFVNSNCYVTGGKLWWLDGINNKLKRVDVETGADYQEWLITIPSYALSASFTAPDQQVDHPAAGNTTVDNISLTGNNPDFVSDGVNYVVPRTGTWNWLVTMNMAWTHGFSTPTCECAHTNQNCTVVVQAGPAGFGPAPFGRWIVGDAAYGANIDDFGFGPVTVQVGNFASDDSGITMYGNGLTTDEGCGISSDVFGTGNALQDGRHTDALSCGQRGRFVVTQPFSCSDGIKSTFLTGLSITFDFVMFPTLNGYTLNGWHNTGRLIAWAWLTSKPPLSIDISSGSPIFTWADEYSPFGNCSGPYDICPLSNNVLVANTLFVQLPNDVDSPTTHPDRFKLGSIWRSSDGGLTWVEIVPETLDLGDTNQNNFISCVAPDPNGANHVCVAIKPPYVYRSTSSGSGFTQETVSYGAATIDPREWTGISILGPGRVGGRHIAQATLIGAT